MDYLAAGELLLNDLAVFLVWCKRDHLVVFVSSDSGIVMWFGFKARNGWTKTSAQ